MTRTKPTKQELLRWGYNQDRGVSFLVNVIHCGCSNQYKKLLGLYRLIQRGAHVSCAQFDCYSIMIDGTHHPLNYLETVPA